MKSTAPSKLPSSSVPTRRSRSASWPTSRCRWPRASSMLEHHRHFAVGVCALPFAASNRTFKAPSPVALQGDGQRERRAVDRSAHIDARARCGRQPTCVQLDSNSARRRSAKRERTLRFGVSIEGGRRAVQAARRLHRTRQFRAQDAEIGHAQIPPCLDVSNIGISRGERRFRRGRAAAARCRSGRRAARREHDGASVYHGAIERECRIGNLSRHVEDRAVAENSDPGRPASRKPRRRIERQADVGITEIDPRLDVPIAGHILTRQCRERRKARHLHIEHDARPAGGDRLSLERQQRMRRLQGERPRVLGDAHRGGDLDRIFLEERRLGPGMRNPSMEPRTEMEP